MAQHVGWERHCARIKEADNSLMSLQRTININAGI